MTALAAIPPGADTAHRPSLLFYCQHSLGIGHLVRSFALCTALAEHFRVVLLSGGTMPEGITLPAGVEVIALPALHANADFTLATADGRPVAEIFEVRLGMLLDAITRHRPSVVVVEFFPFGRKKFGTELIPFLEAARATGASTACSLRDILVTRDDGGKHDERASTTANRLLDAVLVHSDPRLAQLDETFHPRTPLAVPVHYTGFVVPDRPGLGELSPNRPPRVVVSVGGGTVGEPLLRAAMDAYPRLHARGLELRIITGPLVPDDLWDLMVESAAGRPGVEIVRVVPDLIAELREAAVSVSQCGYNTALDLIRAQVPAVVSPLVEDGDEEPRRASRLAELGLVHVVPRAALNGDNLADAILAATFAPPSPAVIDLDGARASARVLAALAANTPSR